VFDAKPEISARLRSWNISPDVFDRRRRRSRQPRRFRIVSYLRLIGPFRPSFQKMQTTRRPRNHSKRSSRSWPSTRGGPWSGSNATEALARGRRARTQSPKAASNSSTPCWPTTLSARVTISNGASCGWAAAGSSQAALRRFPTSSSVRTFAFDPTPGELSKQRARDDWP
jgi:hypothetical protein